MLAIIYLYEDVSPDMKQKFTFIFLSLLAISLLGGCYSVFHGFEQAKFAKSGSILGSSQFLIVPAAFKNDASFKSGQNLL
jgi:hypothetical protein